jgi:hypothetical protein
MDLILEEHEPLALLVANCPHQRLVKTFLNRRDDNNWFPV